MDTPAQSLFSQKHLRVLYYQYRETSLFSVAVSLLILLVNLLVFLLVVRPQYAAFQEDRQQIAQTREKIVILKKNNEVLASKDPSQLSADLQVALSAMPHEQDYAGIMNAIASAALNAGVSLEDYNFHLGELNSSKPDLLPVVVSVDVTGGGTSVKQFMQEIHEKLPVASITSLDGTSNTTTVNVTFFSKPLSQITLSEEKVTQPLKDPTASEGVLLNQLYTWQQSVQIPSTEFFSASDSSSIDPF